LLDLAGQPVIRASPEHCQKGASATIEKRVPMILQLADGHIGHQHVAILPIFNLGQLSAVHSDSVVVTRCATTGTSTFRESTDSQQPVPSHFGGKKATRYPDPRRHTTGTLRPGSMRVVILRVVTCDELAQ
jgi:hypothetical protein